MAEYTSIQSTGRTHRLAIAGLVILSAGGLFAFALSYTQGHRLLGSSNAVPWGMPIVMAIYLIGLSAGSLILSSLAYVFGREQYKPISRMAVFLALALIFGAMLSIAVDLGRPEKFWRLFTMGYLSNMTSMFAINAILYSGYFAISLLYLAVILAGRRRATRSLGIVAVCWAVLVHMGTGAIFGFVAAREAWASPLKPLEFLAAALASGMALLIIVAVGVLRSAGRRLDIAVLRALGRMLSAFVLILLLLVAVDKLTHYYAPARDAAAYTLSGPYAWIFWVFQIGMGAVIPLAVLLNPRLNQSGVWVVAAAASVVTGVFFERLYLVMPGAAYPLALYPGQTEGMWGGTGVFTITPVETLLSAGIASMVALVFLLGLRYLELAPGEATAEPKTAGAAR